MRERVTTSAVVVGAAVAGVVGGVLWSWLPAVAAGPPVYASWTAVAGAPATGTATVAATGFPAATFTTTSTTPTVGGGTSAFLNASTPFGARFGSSQGQQYLSVRTATGNAPSTTTITFAGATPASDWGLAFGDVDADRVQIIASGPGGPLSAVDLGWQSAFNYCSGSPRPGTCAGTSSVVPSWDPSTTTVTGAGGDSDGASGWFAPTASVDSITLTFSRLNAQSGSPAFQLWLVGSAPDPTPTATPTATTTPTTSGSPTDTATPTDTGTPTGSATSSPSGSPSDSDLPSATAKAPSSGASTAEATDSASPGARGSGTGSNSGTGSGTGVLARTGSTLAPVLASATLLVMVGLALRLATRPRRH